MGVKCAFLPFLIISFFLIDISAQNYPDTIWIPVTYYDFHSDQSNPEFECDHQGGVRTGMVGTTLDTDKKIVAGSNPQNYLNNYIKYWYRDWNDGAKNDFTIPTYTQTGGSAPFNATIQYTGITSVAYDTAFKNIVIEDSLPFRHIGNGVYEYRDDSFFPIDGRGFGNEGKNHNFSFTMELQTTFIMKPGLTFNFRGDDDVWAFINNKLVMDLGGIHSAANGSFQTDNISGLTVGQEYPFSLFFAERHTTGSHIWITSNIVSTHIATEVTIVAHPADASIPAGDSVLYMGTVWYDSSGSDGINHHLPDSNLSQNLTWSFVSNNPQTNMTQSSLSNAVGVQTVFTSTEAFETFTITAAYQDPVTQTITSAQMNVTIIAGPPNHLTVEETHDTSLSLTIKQNDQPLDTLTISATQLTNAAYAMLRDQYGNFVNYSKQTLWNILTGSAVVSAANGNTAQGQGIMTKNGPSGMGFVSAKDLVNNGPSYTDSLYVRILNDQPVANNDIYSTAEDVALVIPTPGMPGVLSNDTDPDASAILTASLVSNVNTGTLIFNQDGSFTYVPPLNFNGNAVFTYKASDGELFSNTATVTLVVGSNNDQPQAFNDAYTIGEDCTLTINVPGVLTNDNDVDGDHVTAHLIQGIEPSQGSLSFQSNGSFIFTPALNYYGKVTFTYQAFDGSLNSNIATVTLTVSPVNDVPLAVGDAYMTNEDIALSVPMAGILSNDIDNDDNPLTAVLVTNVSNGTLALNNTGSFVYTPNLNFYGLEIFTYRAFDNSSYSNTATVSITVVPVNDVPIVNNENYSVYEDATLVVPAGSGVLSNDTDVEGSNLTVSLISGIDASSGILTLNTDGSFTYIPTPNYSGTVIFTYQANDGAAYSNTGTVMIFVTPINDPPIANNDGYGTMQNVDLIISAANGVMANDFDIDGDNLSASLVTGIHPDTGTLTFNTNGSFTYDPHAAFTGNFTFTYVLSDDSTTSNTATVTIWVNDVNEAPVAINDTFTTNEDATLTVPAGSVLANDSDQDIDPLTALLIHGISASEGTLTLNANGSFIYVPSNNFNGSISFTYQAYDGKLNSNIASVTIDVISINDAPVVHNDNYVTDEDVVLNVPTPSIPGVLSNDADIEAQSLTVVLASTMQPAFGTLSLNPSGSFTYTPKKHFNGIATFSYKAYDGIAYSDASTVTITVNSINDPPVINTIPDQSITKGSTFQSISLDEYLSDPDHEASSMLWTYTGSSELAISIDPTTHIATITILDSTKHGSETITFTAQDPQGLFVSDDVTFTITPLPRLPMPETDTTPGEYKDHTLSMNLYVPGYSSAQIYYTYTTNGTTPKNPKTHTSEIIQGSGMVHFGNQVKDSTHLKIIAYASQYPYESSENKTFEYQLVFPPLPAPQASHAAGDYDTVGLNINLSVPGHSDAAIYYTLDGTDPATSSTKFLYNQGNPIPLGPYNQITTASIRVYATKAYYKAGTKDFVYNFNPQHLPKPVADPPGHRFHNDSITVALYVPNISNAEIRYTTDGSKPNLNSDLYINKIPIKKNTTIKAIAIQDGYLQGPVMTEVYIQSLPTSLEIHSNMTAPSPYPSTIACKAGEPLPLYAKIFDQYDTCLTEFATNGAPISWEIKEISGNGSGSLKNTTGYMTNFNPVKAYNTIKIAATFNKGGFIFSKEIIVIIEPGKPHKLWLEADWDRLVSPHKPNPLQSLKLSSNNTQKKVYAILRDSIGNWAATSKNTSWQPVVNSIATVGSGLQNVGEGVIFKGPNSGTLEVVGENLDLSLPYPKDSVTVTVLSYWYDSLKIVCSPTQTDGVDSIIINSNQDTTIFVFGHRDDGLQPAWEKVDANWDIIDLSLHYNIANPPASAHEYVLSPMDTAQGRIRVGLDDDSVTIPDTVWVKFLPGPPVKAEFILLTDQDSLFAGDRFKTEVRLYNEDNKLVYGTWNFPGNGDSVMYDDILGDGGRPQPYCIVDSLSYTLQNQGSFVKESFVNGIDTLEFVLFYAPFDEDSLHQLSVTFEYNMKACTQPFRLLPANLDIIDIVVDNATPDTVNLYHNTGQLIKTVGFDMFGNKIDLVECNWTKTGDIPSIPYSHGTKQIYYSIGEISYESSGYIIAKHIDDMTISDTLFVIIRPKPASLLSAVTKDVTGNGYLDGIALFFDKKIHFPENVYSDQLITLDYVLNTDTIHLMMKDILPGTAESLQYPDSIFLLVIKEYESGQTPQTDWIPTISITGIEDIEEITQKPCLDGASPVIWDVEKKKASNGNTEMDQIVVTLTEPFVNIDGSAFMHAAIKPMNVFHVWTRSGNSFELVDGMLDEIEYFTEKNVTTLFFYTSNGNEINATHFFSLTYTDSVLSDLSLNTPVENNQKVRVRVSGKIEKLIVGPNPIKPTLKFYETDKHKPLMHIDPKVAYNKVKNYGGAIVVVDVNFNGLDATKASAQLMIFDATGNLVHAKENRENVIPKEWDLTKKGYTETRQLVFYWDGISDRGMVTSPGVYRAIVYVHFGKEIKKLIGTMAVGR